MLSYKSLLKLMLCVGLCAGMGFAQEGGGLKAPAETYDWATPMKEVAKKFSGTQGVYLLVGDSITYANPNTQYCRYGQGQSPAEKAFLKWAHAGEKNDSDGFHLASADAAGGRSHTAVSGIRADESLKGGKAGIPALDALIKKYNPQLVLYMLGTNDLSGNRPVAQYIADVEKAMDLFLANGTVPILSTLPPHKHRLEACEAYNTALRQLAEKKKIPLLDLNAEMKARAGDGYMDAYLDKDGIHLSVNGIAAGPATEENLKKSGYLLRGYTTVQKGMIVKAQVLDAK